MRATLMIACLALGFLASTPSQAQVFVVGNGDASACWRAAEFGQGTMEEGFDACNHALENTQLSLRDRAATLVNRAVIRIRAGDNTGALADATQSINMIPNMGEAHVNRGAALLNLMHPDQALQEIDKGIALGSTKLYLVYYNRATSEFLLGNVRQAYFDYKHAAEINPDFALAAAALSKFKVIRRTDSADASPDDSVADVIALGSPVNLKGAAADVAQ